MGWHVHHKDGKFAIWSTITDAYITPWETRKLIIEYYKDRAVKRAEWDAIINIESAEKHGCSAMQPFRCSTEEMIEK